MGSASDENHTASKPKYSVCITNYNTGRTIRESLKSLLSQLDSSFEVVVCDNCSNDGSGEILSEYARAGKLSLIVQKSTRGRGRQIAFEHSNGDYILSGFDMDDTFRATIKDILSLYHEKHEGYMLSFLTVHIIPRAIVEEVRGWKDIQRYEDVEFSRRVQRIRKLHYFGDPSALIMKKGHPKRDFLHSLREMYTGYETRYRMGDDIFQDLARNTLFSTHVVRSEYWRLIQFWIAFLVVAACRLKHVKRFNY